MSVWTNAEYVDLVQWLAEVHGAVESGTPRSMRGRDWVYSRWVLGTIAEALEFARAMNRLKKTTGFVFT